jgi:hypothetical protein
MVANQHYYGFRWHSSISGTACPKPIEVPVASGYQAAVNGGGNVNINIGDPIRLAGGFAVMAAGNEAAAGAAEPVYGIVVAIRPYNANPGSPTMLEPTDVLPGGTTYTNSVSQSILEVVPAAGSYWACDVLNAGAAFDTYNEYLTLVNKNVDHLLDDTGQNKADPVLDLTAPTTATKQWRVQGVSKNAKNQDFAGAYVELIVAINETQQAPFVVVGT